MPKVRRTTPLRPAPRPPEVPVLDCDRAPASHSVSCPTCHSNDLWIRELAEQIADEASNAADLLRIAVPMKGTAANRPVLLIGALHQLEASLAHAKTVLDIVSAPPPAERTRVRTLELSREATS
jgi:hypothetical protein